MNMSTAMRLSVSVLAIMLCFGCSYMHRVVNTGDSMLYAVTVQSGSHKFGHGYLPPKATAGYSGSMKISRSPAPIVSWKLSEKGETMSQAVKLDSSPGLREVVFEIDGKTVTGSLGRR